MVIYYGKDYSLQEVYMNKRAIILFSLILSGIVCLAAQDRTVTLDGRKIILHEDFTWEYAGQEKKKGTIRVLDVDNTEKDLFQSSNGKYSVYVDTGYWMQTSGLNPQAQLQFKNHDDTAFAMIIHEGLELPLDSLKELMIINAGNLDPNARILDVEPCSINGLEGELVTYTAHTAGLDFIFFSFITSTHNGTVQFTCYTLETVFGRLKTEFIDLISGFEFY